MWIFLQRKMSRIARVIAVYLQRYVNRLSARTRVAVAIIFFIAGSVVLVSLIVTTWLHPGAFLSVQAIRVPSVVTIPEPSSTETLRQQAVLRHLQHASYLIDSLRTHAAAKAQYDSLIQTRPGLLDSLRQAQALFLHPFNNVP